MNEYTITATVQGDGSAPEDINLSETIFNCDAIVAASTEAAQQAAVDMLLAALAADGYMVAETTTSGTYHIVPPMGSNEASGIIYNIAAAAIA